MALDLVEDDLLKLRAFGVSPTAVDQAVGHVLDEDGGHMLARRGQRGIKPRRQHHLDIGIARHDPLFPVIIGAFHVGDGAAQADVAFKGCAIAVNPGKFRQAIERDIELGGRTACLEPRNTFGEALRQHLPVEQRQDGLLQLQAGQDDACTDLAAISQHHAGCLAAGGLNLVDRAFETDVAPFLNDTGGQGAGYCTHAAPHIAPGTTGAVDTTGPVVQHDVGAAGGHWPKSRSDHRRCREMCFHNVGFEIAIQQVLRRQGPEPHGIRQGSR